MATNYGKRKPYQIQRGEQAFEIDAMFDQLYRVVGKLPTSAVVGPDGPTGPQGPPGLDGDDGLDGDAGNVVPTSISVTDTADSTCFVGLFEDATGALSPKTDANLTYDASTGLLTAAGFVGPLTGNVTGNVSGSAATFTGNLTGDVTSTGMATAIAAGVIVDADVSATAAVAWTKISKTGSSLADLATRSAADLSSGILLDARMPNLTGDVTTVEGAVAATLATVNSNVGSFGSSTAIPSFSVNAKGLVTAASTNVVIAPAGTLTGTVLAANVVTSSLTSVGALNSGSITSGFGAINIGADALTAGALSGTSASFSTTLGVTGATTLGSTLGVTGVSTFSNTANFNGSVIVLPAGVTNAQINLIGNQAGDVTWLLMSGYPSAGQFTIRESGVANRLTIDKTTGATTITGATTFTGGLISAGSQPITVTDNSNGVLWNRATIDSYRVALTGAGLKVTNATDGRAEMAFDGAGNVSFPGGGLSVAGTLGVTGATTLGSTLGVTGVSTFSNTANFNGSVIVLPAGVTNAQINLIGNQAGDVTWLLMSGYPSAGQFTIRESGVANRLTIDKTTGATTITGATTLSSTLAFGGHVTASADNTYDIGASGASRPRTIYAGTSVVAPAYTASTGGVEIASSVPGVTTNKLYQSGSVLYWNGGAVGTGGAGDVVGPASAVDNGFVLFDGTTGKLVKDGGATVSLTTQVSGDLPLANIAPASAASKLLGRGDSGAGDYQEVTLGTGLSMSGTTLSAAGGGSYTKIAEQTPTGTSVTFSSLGSYTHLEIRFSARGDQAASNTVVSLRFNGDTGSNYDLQQLSANGTTVGATEALAQPSTTVGNIVAGTGTAGVAGTGTIKIHDYRGTSFHKNIDSRIQLPRLLTSTNFYYQVFAGRWRNTAAVTSITLTLAFGNFVAGSKFSLYGIE